MSESTFYYREKTGRKGRKPSEYTLHNAKRSVEEAEVVLAIKGLFLKYEFLDCGYKVVTAYLKRDGYRINHKKVYRIMKKARLLKTSNRIMADRKGRKFVRFRKVKAQRPFQCLEMDIKMVWIPEKGKNAYLFSVIDVFTRKILTDLLAFSVKKKDVITCLEKLLEEYQYPEQVVIRSDNGSQFIASDVRQYLELIGVGQEFTHVATPKENAHIEAYHGILKREIFDRFEYRTFGQIQQILNRYRQFYNNERLHGGLKWNTPQEKWESAKHQVIFRKDVA